jgi:dipeptidyl aminopeptidase/acylaminoacyl peptidase
VRGWANILAKAGFRAILVDLRGHGRSTGDSLTYGVVESRDLTQVLSALAARGLVAGGLGVMGISYGAATAIEWAAKDPRVSAVVAVAPFASLRMVAPGYTVVPLPRSMVDGAIERAGKEGDFDPDEASPALAMARMHTPVLLIHGEDDARVPAWHSQLLYAAGRSHTELLLVPGAGHASIAVSHVIADFVPGWFAAHLPAPASAAPVEDDDAAP